jgi:hypothetical protein
MLCLLLVGRKKKKRNSWRFSPQGWTHLAGCAMGDFCSSLLQLKADLRVSLWAEAAMLRGPESSEEVKKKVSL